MLIAAIGVLFRTWMTIVLMPFAPLSSVTIRVTLNVPTVVNVWVTGAPVVVVWSTVPSPSQSHP